MLNIQDLDLGLITEEKCILQMSWSSNHFHLHTMKAATRNLGHADAIFVMSICAVCSKELKRLTEELPV